MASVEDYMKEEPKVEVSSVPSLPTDDVEVKRESLAILASLGTTKEYLGVNMHMSLGDIKKLSSKDVEKYFNRYQTVLGKQVTGGLVESALQAVSHVISYVVPVDDTEALSKDLQNDELVKRELSNFAGLLVLKGGRMVALASALFQMSDENQFVEQITKNPLPEKKSATKEKDPKKVASGRKLAEYNRKAKESLAREMKRVAETLPEEATVDDEGSSQKAWIPELSFTTVLSLMRYYKNRVVDLSQVPTHVPESFKEPPPSKISIPQTTGRASTGPKIGMHMYLAKSLDKKHEDEERIRHDKALEAYEKQMGEYEKKRQAYQDWLTKEYTDKKLADENLDSTDQAFILYKRAHPNVNFDIDDKPQFKDYYTPSSKQKQYEMIYIGGEEGREDLNTTVDEDYDCLIPNYGEGIESWNERISKRFGRGASYVKGRLIDLWKTRNPGRVVPEYMELQNMEDSSTDRLRNNLKRDENHNNWCTFYNRWKNLSSEGTVTDGEGQEPILRIPAGYYTVETVKRQIDEALRLGEKSISIEKSSLKAHQNVVLNDSLADLLGLKNKSLKAKSQHEIQIKTLDAIFIHCDLVSASGVLKQEAPSQILACIELDKGKINFRPHSPIQLSTTSVDYSGGDNFRLQKTYDALGSLEKEVKHYENVRKKYKRTQSTFSKLSMGTGVLSVILGSSGLGTSLSGFVVGVPLGALGGVFGLTSVGCAAVSKRLSNKVSKHDATVATAKSKANSMTARDLVSKALKDNKISDEEFSLILNEVDKFQALKQSIRRKSRKEEKNVDINKMRDEVRAEILKNLTQKDR
ncbi:hypothetical protein AC249_AIPGENE3336 [Exaiptasia diaphana]|nr:hypothetical protein AC249_AIPGENE3336 [Exaiptasia diaphana]